MDYTENPFMESFVFTLFWVWDLSYKSKNRMNIHCKNWLWNSVINWQQVTNNLLYKKHSN